MVFEIGKCYQYTTGIRMKVLGRLKTTVWGECLIAETSSMKLIPVGLDESAAVNYREISESQWENCWCND